MKLYLFGSRARGDAHMDSAVEVFVVDPTETFLRRMHEFSKERGGQLDLFVWADGHLRGAYSDRTIVGDDPPSVFAEIGEARLLAMLPPPPPRRWRRLPR